MNAIQFILLLDAIITYVPVYWQPYTLCTYQSPSLLLIYPVSYKYAMHTPVPPVISKCIGIVSLTWLGSLSIFSLPALDRILLHSYK